MWMTLTLVLVLWNGPIEEGCVPITKGRREKVVTFEARSGLAWYRPGTLEEAVTLLQEEVRKVHGDQVLVTGVTRRYWTTKADDVEWRVEGIGYRCNEEEVRQP